MNAVQTSPFGVVNQDTVFIFSQTNNLISASYAGGHIVKGFLVGQIKADKLSFSFCQLQDNGVLDNGISNCSIILTGKGKVRLVEHFEWKTRAGDKGTNIIEEI